MYFRAEPIGRVLLMFLYGVFFRERPLCCKQRNKTDRRVGKAGVGEECISALSRCWRRGSLRPVPG
jgi:hypothetical protein